MSRHFDDDALADLGLAVLVESVLAEMAEKGEMARDADGRWHRTEKGWKKVALDAGITALGPHDTWESVCRLNGLGIVPQEING